MDKKDAIEIATRYVKLISQKYQIENAIMFGSFAKGSQNADSDIDIAIVFSVIDDIIERQIDLMNMRRDEDLIIEPHPFALKSFNNTNPIAVEIMKNGIDLLTAA